MTETSNLDRIKDLLGEWTKYYKPFEERGWPRNASFYYERVQQSMSADSAAQYIPDDVATLNKYIDGDKSLRGLPPLFKRIIALHYFDHRPAKTKAKLLGLPTQIFYERLRYIHEQLTWSMWGKNE